MCSEFDKVVSRYLGIGLIGYPISCVASMLRCFSYLSVSLVSFSSLSYASELV